MGTSFEGAFEEVVHLPQSKRLLIGQGTAIDDLAWIAASIDDADPAEDFGDSELARELRERIVQFRSGEAQTTLALITGGKGLVTVLVLGASSVESCARLMKRCAERAAEDYVADYLTEKQAEWRRPLARVIPFRRKPR